MTAIAATLTKKKTTIRKGQLKKTIKNILCRVDAVFWPEISNEDANLLEKQLDKYKVDIPQFEKPHWSKIKHLPKEKRPRPPKIEKVGGLLFGITECNNSIQSGSCSAVVIEASVNPQIIAKSIIESCVKKEIPVVCMKDLKRVCSKKFGIPTSFLGVKANSLKDLDEIIAKMSTQVKYESNEVSTEESETSVQQDIEMKLPAEAAETNKTDKMDCSIKIKATSETNLHSNCPHLFRTSKKERVFVPLRESDEIVPKKFVGQDKISFSQPAPENQQVFKKMLLKRISNNPNRKTKKKKEKK